MPKFKTIATEKTIIKFVLKSLLSTVISIFLFSTIVSIIIYKIDISTQYCNVFGVIIVALCSGIISFVSVSGIKNNGMLIGLISQIPIILYTIINTIFYDNSIIILLIKIAIIIVIGSFIGLTSTQKSKKFKVK